MVSTGMDLNQVRLSIKNEGEREMVGAPLGKERTFFGRQSDKRGSTGCFSNSNNGFCFRWKRRIIPLYIKTRTRKKKKKKNTPLGYSPQKGPFTPGVFSSVYLILTFSWKRGKGTCVFFFFFFIALFNFFVVIVITSFGRGFWAHKKSHNNSKASQKCCLSAVSAPKTEGGRLVRAALLRKSMQLAKELRLIL
ncbi:hypothetical protein CEXT_214661 [Caerostris extrusa]|uniref:Transmembrane protein n=1 Tax=Caerostris extrusa TaxID=172846 RepID=A0AAV4PHX9_CAEEX|nr:hypothetical protein CEXT_214661 [Caerostris extrusa]